MDGVLWQLKMIVGIRAQKRRIAIMMQRRIIAWDRGENRETVEAEK